MKNIRLAILFGLIASVLVSMAHFDVLCEDLRDNVFRLHIIANSDSSEDQALKIKVRDEILKKSGELYLNIENTTDAIAVTNANTDLLLAVAKKVVEENGYNYGISINVGKSYFENREYETFTLPAGEYNALNIIIGEGKGKNWWCVMFPAVCIGAAADLDQAVSKSSAELAKDAEQYTFKFKTVEIYQNLKKYFQKK